MVLAKLTYRDGDVLQFCEFACPPAIKVVQQFIILLGVRGIECDKLNRAERVEMEDAIVGESSKCDKDS